MTQLYTAKAIKNAVDNGHKVHWASTLYEVRKDQVGQYLIICTDNDHCVGLTDRQGKLRKGEEHQFFTLDRNVCGTCGGHQEDDGACYSCDILNVYGEVA